MMNNGYIIAYIYEKRMKSGRKNRKSISRKRISIYLNISIV